MKLTAIVAALIASALGSISCYGQSQTPDTSAPLTAADCVALTLQNSAQVRNAKNEVEMAVNLRREAFTKYFPEIAATGMIFWANHDILQYNLLNLIELGIIKNGRMAGIQAMQPVFVGGQIVNGNRLAAVGEEVARLRQSQTDNELRLTTETLFWKLATLEATQETLRAAIATLDSLERQVNVAVDAGLAMRNDLLKVQLKRNTFRSEMVDLEQGIALVKMLLGQYMGMGTDASFAIAADVPLATPPMPYDLYIAPADALPMTIDYQLLNKNVQAKRLEKRVELGKNLPTVAVGAGWYYHNVLKQNHNFGAVQIGVAIPISSWWGGSYALKKKSLALTNAENERDDLSQKLQIAMQDKWNNLTAAHRKMEIEAEGIAQSLENCRLNTMYYEAGMVTVTDLLEAETALKQAKSQFIAAFGEFATARAAYLIATAR